MSESVEQKVLRPLLCICGTCTRILKCNHDAARAFIRMIDCIEATVDVILSLPNRFYRTKDERRNDELLANATTLANIASLSASYLEYLHECGQTKSSWEHVAELEKLAKISERVTLMGFSQSENFGIPISQQPFTTELFSDDCNKYPRALLSALNPVPLQAVKWLDSYEIVPWISCSMNTDEIERDLSEAVAEMTTMEKEAKAAAELARAQKAAEELVRAQKAMRAQKEAEYVRMMADLACFSFVADERRRRAARVCKVPVTTHRRRWSAQLTTRHARRTFCSVSREEVSSVVHKFGRRGMRAKVCR